MHVKGIYWSRKYWPDYYWPKYYWPIREIVELIKCSIESITAQLKIISKSIRAIESLSEIRSFRNKNKKEIEVIMNKNIIRQR